MKTHLTLTIFLLCIMVSLSMPTPIDAQENKEQKKEGLRKKYLAAKKLYEKRKKEGASKVELEKLEANMKKARRKWRWALLGIITAAAVVTTAAAVGTKMALEKQKENLAETRPTRFKEAQKTIVQYRETFNKWSVKITGFLEAMRTELDKAESSQINLADVMIYQNIDEKLAKPLENLKTAVEDAINAAKAAELAKDGENVSAAMETAIHKTENFRQLLAQVEKNFNSTKDYLLRTYGADYKPIKLDKPITLD